MRGTSGWLLRPAKSWRIRTPTPDPIPTGSPTWPTRFGVPHTLALVVGTFPRQAMGWVAACVANAPGRPIHVLLSDHEAEHIPGVCMAFRRDALERIGGFDTQFRAAGDDVDICWRLQKEGMTLGFAHGAFVWHHHRDSVRDYWKQQRGYGHAEALLERKWPDKYNSPGHLTWGGRLYGRGLTLPLGRVSRIYHGLWGSGAVSVARRAPDRRDPVATADARVVSAGGLAGGAFVPRPRLASAAAVGAAPCRLHRAAGVPGLGQCGAGRVYERRALDRRSGQTTCRDHVAPSASAAGSFAGAVQSGAHPLASARPGRMGTALGATGRPMDQTMAGSRRTAPRDGSRPAGTRRRRALRWELRPLGSGSPDRSAWTGPRLDGRRGHRIWHPTRTDTCVAALLDAGGHRRTRVGSAGGRCRPRPRRVVCGCRDHGCAGGPAVFPRGGRMRCRGACDRVRAAGLRRRRIGAARHRDRRFRRRVGRR